MGIYSNQLSPNIDPLPDSRKNPFSEPSAVDSHISSVDTHYSHGSGNITIESSCRHHIITSQSPSRFPATSHRQSQYPFQAHITDVSWSSLLWSLYALSHHKLELVSRWMISACDDFIYPCTPTVRPSYFVLYMRTVYLQGLVGSSKLFVILLRPLFSVSYR